jgi:hypothetical protein
MLRLSQYEYEYFSFISRSKVSATSFGLHFESASRPSQSSVSLVSRNCAYSRKVGRPVRNK